ncbi:hypothetical protein FSARC_5030 [Fusarium sarcochroum]|uniref:FAD dependent oxidoreductase domain-containing protein n=1 Tax=Fusarium sarcochroum TaxID=1208366 RepID=A0A8H4U0J2_9HYPO|nr:hypothetical protein FSARC_5030 [Fusarium sarcochroum]
MGETIVVIGAGVIGLTTALLLSKDRANAVTVVAKHMPGDYDIEYASPFAGANVVPMATKENSHIEVQTWQELKRLCENVPEAGIHFQSACSNPALVWHKKTDPSYTECRLKRRNKDLEHTTVPAGIFDPNPWFRTLFQDYRDLSPSELEGPYDSSSEWTSVCINTAIYLPWLVGQLLKNNVVLKRAVLSDIGDAKGLSHTGNPASIIVNATGLGSLKLGGVRDTNMMPARGQIVLVRNEAPMFGTSGTEDEPSDICYSMTRAAGGGTILGGTYDLGNWESQPDPNTANRIMARIVNEHPEIADGKGIAGLSIIRHAVGLRPYRKNGVRIEEEKLDSDTWIVHNYGHSGWGYQGSYGSAKMACELVEKIGKSKHNLTAKL